MTSGGDRPSEAAPGTLPHRPLLDGWRGTLILVAIAYHLDGPTSAPGGWVGLNGFFVLSGFLITNLLLAETARTGRVCLSRFFARRVRRLAPALLVSLAGTLVAARFLGGVARFPGLREDGLASLFYVANWRFIASDESYFSSFSPSPLRHMWSLAIEEQFYLLWPLLLPVLLRVIGRRRLPVALVAGIVASAWWMRHLVMATGDPSRAYYDTGARAQELLFGVLLATLAPLDHHSRLPTGRARTLANLAGGVGLVGFFTAMLVFPAGSPAIYTRGAFAATATASALVVLSFSRITTGPLAVVFGSRFMRGLGARSYSLYLVHWPVFIFLGPTRVDWHPALLDVVRVTLSLAVAEVVHQVVEKPIHQRRWVVPRPGAVLAGAAAATAGVVLVTTIATVPVLRPPDEGAVVVTLPPRPGDGGPPGTGPPGTNPGDHVVVLGDSQAYILLVTPPEDLPLQVSGVHHARCDVIGAEIVVGGERNTEEETCPNWPRSWAEGLAGGADAVVVTLGLRQLFDPVVDGRRLAVGSPDWEQAYRASIDRAVAVIRAETDAPIVWMDVPCYRWESAEHRGDEAQDPERIRAVNAALARALAPHPGVTLVPYGPRVCNGPAHSRPDDGLRPDGAHLTADAAADTWRWLLGRIRAAQALS